MGNDEFEVDEEKRDTLKKFVTGVLGSLSPSVDFSNSVDSESSDSSESSSENFLEDAGALRIDPNFINFGGDEYLIQEHESGYVILNGQDLAGSPGQISRAQVEGWSKENFWRRKIEEYRSADQQVTEFEVGEDLNPEEEWYENPMFTDEKVADVNRHGGNLEFVFQYTPGSAEDSYETHIGQSYEAHFIAGKTYIHFYDEGTESWHDVLQNDGDLDLLGEVIRSYR